MSTVCQHCLAVSYGDDLRAILDAAENLGEVAWMPCKKHTPEALETQVRVRGLLPGLNALMARLFALGAFRGVR